MRKDANSAGIAGRSGAACGRRNGSSITSPSHRCRLMKRSFVTLLYRLWNIMTVMGLFGPLRFWCSVRRNTRSTHTASISRQKPQANPAAPAAAGQVPGPSPEPPPSAASPGDSGTTNINAVPSCLDIAICLWSPSVPGASVGRPGGQFLSQMKTQSHPTVQFHMSYFMHVRASSM